MDYWFSASHEMFPPSELLAQAQAASEAGFDGIGGSDHFAPWWPEGQSGNAWVWLGAVGQAIPRLPIGTGVTALVHRYHPAVVAQAFMSLEELFPGRVFLGAGSGEALNEVPCGADWPSVGEQVQRMEQALDVITRLWDGETVTADHGWFAVKDCRLHTRARSRPKLYVSAFGERAAGVAARYGDGVWTLGDPESAPAVVEAYRSAGGEGEVIVHAGFAWAQDDAALMDGVRVWRATQPDEFYVDDWHDPARMQDHAARTITDKDLREGFVISTEPGEHVEQVRALEELGATVVCLQNMSGADPLGTIALYRDEVLPALRGDRARV
jgi:coenzyme F420-dependent glucose-6-phosphate dehydrogenase